MLSNENALEIDPQPEDKLDQGDDLFHEIEDLVEVPEEELVEVLIDEDLFEDLVDELGLFLHDINLQPLLSREDEFRLFMLIKAGNKVNEIVFKWGNQDNTECVINVVLNIYQKTLESWAELQKVCKKSNIFLPSLGDIFTEICTQRFANYSGNFSTIGNWLDRIPIEESVREQAGSKIMEIIIAFMLLPADVIQWLSGHLSKDDERFPALSSIANWIINNESLHLEMQKLSEISKQANNQMVLSNMRLVIWTARRYQRRGVELADLIQIGTIGLLRAIKKFNPVRGFKFSTYATWWIRQSITRDIADYSRLIRIPVHVHDKIYLVNRIYDNLVQKLSRRPTPEEIANEDLGLSAERVRKILLISNEPLSLDMKIGDSDDNVFGDFIPDTINQEPVSLVERKILHEILDSVLEKLPARERKVLALRYGLDGDAPRTLEEVGGMMGVTRERIRQIESSALHNLRHPIRIKYLKGLLD